MASKKRSKKPTDDEVSRRLLKASRLRQKLGWTSDHRASNHFMKARRNRAEQLRDEAVALAGDDEKEEDDHG